MKPHSPAMHEQLSAYLDGELPPDEMREVERRLATDDTLREELCRMEKTWQLLDTLPRTRVDTSFTETTMELVATAVGEEARGGRWMPPWLSLGRVLAGVLAIAAGLLSFTAARWAPHPDRVLIEHFGLINNLDKYQEIESLELLEMLADEKLFIPPEGNHVP